MRASPSAPLLSSVAGPCVALTAPSAIPPPRRRITVWPSQAANEVQTPLYACSSAAHRAVSATVDFGRLTAFLVALAIPYFTINIGATGISTFPEDLKSVQAFNILDEEFSAGRIDPVEVVIEGDVASPDVQASIARLRESLAGDASFAEVSELQAGPTGQSGYVSIFLNGDATSPDAMSALRRLRGDTSPRLRRLRLDVYVGAHRQPSITRPLTLPAHRHRMRALPDLPC